MNKYCPNCGSPAIAEGRKIICEACDAVYTVTQDGAKVETLGPFADHEKRIRDLEGKGQPADDLPADDQPADDQPADDLPADDQPADDQDDEPLW
jgi:uncharacterized Zn finger protein (UPF0148 family)